MLSRTLAIRSILSNVITKRQLTVTPLRLQQQQETERVGLREITKDRTEVIPLETSIRYLKSAAYKQTYGEEPVWVPYRRNHKGAIPPRKTRKTCIRGGQISTGSPCPICRDEYLVLHEEHLELLKQFISPQTGAILETSKTGLCRKRQLELEVCIQRAQDQGLLTFDVPFRKYDYSLYNPLFKK
ncbi:28S ribosomal protein S18b, mitochondrial [Anthonomus grandis grandis]|uniref:28S ribosomal protein S18b, mitochondrial n=1 Tax=Anthonomus grandis grandis TaxID=2921223 RepID=UPI0021659873|nr:28S ribosomal protein S18b, mitochondrial [Anthonomus grandis grandis]